MFQEWNSSCAWFTHAQHNYVYLCLVECFYIWKEFNKFLYLIIFFFKILFWIFPTIFQGVFSVSCYLFLLLSICLKHNILKQTKTNCVQEQKKNYVCSMLILLHFFFDEFLEMFAFHEIICETQKVCSFYSWTVYI